jgi:WD40 repeat protein
LLATVLVFLRDGLVRAELPAEQDGPSGAKQTGSDRAQPALPAGVIARIGREVLRGEEAAYPALSPDGQTLVSGGWDGLVHVWNVATGKEERRFQHECGIHALALSPDGKTLATAGTSSAIQLWDPASGAKRGRLTGHTNDVVTLAFSANSSQLASGSLDGTTQIWEVATGKPRRQLPGAGALTFAPGGKLVALGDGDTVHLHDPVTGTRIRQLAYSARRYSFVSDLAFSPEGRLLAAAHHDGTIGLWEATTGRALLRWKAEEHGASAVAFSPDGKMLASGGSGRISLWEVATGRLRQVFVESRGGIVGLCFSLDGEVLVSGNTVATLLLWDVTGRVQAERQRQRALAPTEVQQLWTDLASADAAKTYRAMCALVQAPEAAVAFLQTVVRRVPQVDQARIAQAIAELDSATFAIRVQATTELRQLGDLAEPALRRALAEGPSLEVQRRAETLLGCIEASAREPKALQAARALEVLEHIRTAQSRRLLLEVAHGAAEARLTREARAALARWARLPRPPR